MEVLNYWIQILIPHNYRELCGELLAPVDTVLVSHPPTEVLNNVSGPLFQSCNMLYPVFHVLIIECDLRKIIALNS